MLGPGGARGPAGGAGGEPPDRPCTQGDGGAGEQPLRCGKHLLLKS